MAAAMLSQTVPAAVSFKAAIGSRQAFLPARAPMATPARQMRVMAKGPRLGQKNNIAKMNNKVSPTFQLLLGETWLNTVLWYEAVDSDLVCAEASALVPMYHQGHAAHMQRTVVHTACACIANTWLSLGLASRH